MKQYVMVGLVGMCGISSAAELLVNPDFKKGWDLPWRLAYSTKEYSGKVRQPQVSKEGDGLPVVNLNVPHASATHYIRLEQKVDLEEGITYLVNFEFKHQGPPGKLAVHTNSERPPRTNSGLRMVVPVDAGWQRFEARFTATKVDKSNGPVLRFSIGDLKGRVSLRNCSLKSVEGPSLAKPEVKVTRLEEAPEVVEVSYSADPINLVDLAEAFAVSMPKAQQAHAGKVYHVNGHVTKATKGMRPGTYALEFNYGSVRAIVGGEAFGAAEFEALEDDIREVRKVLKEIEKEAKKKRNYEKLSSAAQREQELSRYPTLECEGKVASYRNKVVELAPTRLVNVTLANP